MRRYLFKQSRPVQKKSFRICKTEIAYDASTMDSDSDPHRFLLHALTKARSPNSARADPPMMFHLEKLPAFSQEKKTFKSCNIRILPDLYCIKFGEWNAHLLFWYQLYAVVWIAYRLKSLFVAFVSFLSHKYSFPWTPRWSIFSKRFFWSAGLFGSNFGWNLPELKVYHFIDFASFNSFLICA